tara:strand:+ start:134 stop:1225 length:1092 start_codon:yes stop_codon:yes gene_type:complete
MAETLENQILHALGQVFDHDKDKNIVSLGIVKNINVEASQVTVILEFDRNDNNLKKIYEESEKVVSEIPGITKFNIVTTYHNDKTETSTTEKNIDTNTEEINSGIGTAKIKYILMVASGKGGVGKSTVATNLAIAFKRIGLKTCLLDADIYGPSIPTMFDINEKPKSDGKQIETLDKYGIATMSIGYMVSDDNPMIWRGLMVMKAINELISKVNWGEADIMVIDMPPGTGDVQLTLTQKLKVDGSLIVTTPQDVALIDAVRGLRMFEKTEIPIIGLIENMSYFVAPDTGKQYPLFGEGKTEKVAERYDYEILTKIPHDPLLLEQCENGHPLTDLVPEHKVSRMFIELAENVLKKLKLQRLANS